MLCDTRAVSTPETPSPDPVRTPPTFREALGLQSRLLREHPGLLVTIGYLTLSLVGMMFSSSLFKRFGVDFFDYAELADFLMAGVREPRSLLVAAGGFVVAWGIWWWSRGIGRTSPTWKRDRARC